MLESKKVGVTVNSNTNGRNKKNQTYYSDK